MVSKLNCWDYKDCGREPGGHSVELLGVCPATEFAETDGVNGGDNAGRLCWCVPGTLCGFHVGGVSNIDESSCFTCDFYTAVQGEEGKSFVPLTDDMMKRARMGSVGEGITGIAHCVKNMLNGLHGGLYMATDEFKQAGVSEDTSRGLQILEKNLGLLQDLTMDMLFYSKDHKPTFSRSDVNSIVDSAVMLVAPKAKSKGVQVIFAPCSDIEYAEIEEKGIYRCVLNLLANALDACNEGDEIHVSITKPALDAVVINVKDDGCGMDKVTQDSVFEMFFSSKGRGGTGMGLAVSRKIVHSHSGRIEVESELGQGSTFKIHLPMKAIF